MSEQRYPLAWPEGWKRTPPRVRRRATFRRHIRGMKPSDGTIVRNAELRPLSVFDAIKRLTREVGLLGVADEILSTNIQVRLDGLPRLNTPEPSDPGAAVYFTLKKKALSLACDRWDRTADNIAAIAQHIDALRRIDRYGVGTLDQAFAGYAALPAKVEWWTVLGVEPGATLDEVEAAFRGLARQHHPDKDGGSHDGMARLTEARQAAREALR